MLLKRLALIPPTLVGITLATFLLVHLAPGDPALVRAGQHETAESLAAFRHAYGLDRPLAARYVSWLARSARLDFGDSLVDGRPVRARIVEALPATLAIALFAALLSYGLAVPLGCALAAGDGRRWARALAALLVLGYGLPAMALAMLLLYAGAPWGGRSAGVLFAAAACLAPAAIVRLARYQRGALLDALRADYVLTARAVGAGPARVLVRHALRNAMLPMVTLLGAELPALLSGSVIVEAAFGVHGLGWLGFEAVLERDYPMLLGLATVGALLTLAGVLAADLSYAAIDPRLRESRLRGRDA